MLLPYKRHTALHMCGLRKIDKSDVAVFAKLDITCKEELERSHRIINTTFQLLVKMGCSFEKNRNCSLDGKVV